MVSVEIYIPTLNRTEYSKQTTLKEFTEKSSYCPILVCPPSEVLTHLKYHPRVMKCPEKNIGRTRQFILEKSRADIVIMADDDLRFYHRYNKDNLKLKKCEDLDSLVSRCVELVKKGYIHGGVSPKQGNNFKPGTERFCFRCCNFHFLDRQEVLRTGARFDQLPVMEDFHFILTLLTSGFQNAVIFDYAWDQRPGSVGGCNTYRTLELQKEAAFGLKEAFPDFVTVVKKHSKTGWSIAKGTRYDVRVQWKKANESSRL